MAILTFTLIRSAATWLPNLLAITDSFNFTQHISGPTHTKGHTLDLVFSFGLNIANVCVEDVCVRDHSCVFFDLTIPLDPPPPKMRAKRCFINEDVVRKFSVLFDPYSLVGFSDADCLDIIDEVAPLNLSNVSHKNHCPWIYEPIKNLQRNCRKVERLWKSTNLEVHRIHLKELRASLNEILRYARTQYFSKLISLNEKNPKILFDTIHSIVCPTDPQIPVFSQADSNALLTFFVEKIRDIRGNTLPPSCYGSVMGHHVMSPRVIT